jgi:hypothetical protein
VTAGLVTLVDGQVDYTGNMTVRFAGLFGREEEGSVLVAARLLPERLPDLRLTTAHALHSSRGAAHPTRLSIRWFVAAA